MGIVIAGSIAIMATAAPTVSREWGSVTGSKVKGIAESLINGTVKMTLEDGRKLDVPVAKLIPEDQEFLRQHFGVTGTDAPKQAAGECITDGLTQPVGEIKGPIDAGEGSTHYVYVPKTLRKNRLAPLLHFNGSGGGNANWVKHHQRGAELNGMIVAASVESKNGPGHPVGNHDHAKRCVAHLIATLPVDPERVYFTGGSGGGAMSFYNAARIKSAGAMPHIGYIPQETTPSRKGHYFVINGTTDFNRYTSANAVDSLGDNAIHRFFVGGHREGPDWLCTEGMAWLNGKYLAGRKSDAKLLSERMDWETSMLDWITEVKATHAHRAYYWCLFLRDDYKLSGVNSNRMVALTKELGTNPTNVAYAKGIKDLDAFSRRQLAPLGTGTKQNHSDPKVAAQAERMAKEYAGVPEIPELAADLAKPTGSQ